MPLACQSVGQSVSLDVSLLNKPSLCVSVSQSTCESAIGAGGMMSSAAATGRGLHAVTTAPTGGVARSDRHDREGRGHGAGQCVICREGVKAGTDVTGKGCTRAPVIFSRNRDVAKDKT